MATTHQLQIAAQGDREIVITRHFDAPRDLVWDAYTRPELTQRWLGVFGGWTLPVCEMDLRVGGTYRYEWHGAAGQRMGAGGVIREVVPNEKIVLTEKFDDPWYEGEALNTVEFATVAGGTRLTMTLRYATRATRDNVLKSPMETGLAASFDKLAEVVAG